MTYATAELQRQFNALVIFGTVSEVDHAAKKLRVTEGALTTGWLPFPAETGRNYRRWRPIKTGQQFVVLCRSGDPNNGVIIGELYNNGNDSPSTDENIDLIEYNSGATIRYDAASNVLDYAGFADVTFNGISAPYHTHNKVRAGTDNTGKPQ